jgi:tetratricopeptide (TPR) repeat protein
MRTTGHIACCAAIAVALLAGCSGSKAYSKKGEKLDEAGLYAEAADMYRQAVQRNPKNVDAKIGLKKTGQQVLNDKLSTFFKAFSVGSEKGAAVNAFLDGKAYYDMVQRTGVSLEIPDSYKRDFEQVKGEFLVELYTRGQDLLADQDYKGAEATFAQIAKLEPGYKDATSLQSMAYLEPLYRSGKEALEAKRYRKAYDDLTKVLDKDPGYKDAGSLRQQALTGGKYTIAVVPFTSAVRNRTDLAPKVQAYATTALTEVSDPFIRVVDRENMDRILEEQRLGLSGVVDEQTAVRVGNLMGAQAVLMGEVIDYQEIAGTARRSTKDGFESYRVKVADPNNPGQVMMVTKFRPVKYAEFYQENKVSISVNYRLVSLETGEVLLSKVVDRTVEDHAYYASYDGAKENLVPARNGAADASDRSRSELQSLLSASREVKPVATLGTDAMRGSCAGIAALVQQELASKLP